MTKKAVATTSISKLSSTEVDMAASPILAKPIAEMTLPERASGYAILNYLKKAIETRMEKLKPVLLSDAEKTGDLQDTGSHHLFVEGTKVRRQKSIGKEPEQSKMFDLLASKRIDPLLAYDEIPTYAYNQSKVDMLIARGMLTKADIDALKKITYSLYVDAAPELEQLLVEAAKAYGAEPKKKALKPS